MSISLPAIDPSMQYKAKATVAGTALVALGVAFEILSEHSPQMRAELEDWPEGQSFCLGVMPHGPSIAVRKQGGRFVYLGRGDHGVPLKVLFKNVDSALLVLTGLLSAHVAFAESRIIVHGPLDEVMPVNRVMAVVVQYLFPGFMLKTLAKRAPAFSREGLAVKARLYAALGPALFVNFTK